MIRTRHAGLRHSNEGAPAWAHFRGVSNITENSTCLATAKEDQKTRRRGEIEISGAPSIGALRIAMGNAAPRMMSAVQTPITPTMPLTTSTARSRSPQWKCRRRRKHFIHSAPRMTKAIPAGCSFGDVSGQETDYSLFMVEEELAEQLEFREQIVEGLTAMTRALVMVAIDILRMWLSFGKYRYTCLLYTSPSPRD